MTTVAENAELPRVTAGRPSWLRRISLGKVMTHLALLTQYGLRILAVIALSTWIGLAVTALVLYGLPRRAADTGEH